MIGKITFFLLSFLTAGAIWYLYALVQASGLHDRRMKGFNALCMVVPFWIILTALPTVAEPGFARAAYYFRSIPLNIVPYISCWFILNFSESKMADSRFIRYFSIGMPALAIGLLFTNSWHHLYLIEFGNPPVTGPAFLAHLTLSVAYIMFIYTILVRYIIKNYRKNPLLIIGGIGTVIPIATYVVYLFFPAIIPYDITPIGYFFTIVFVAYSSYSSRLRKAKPGLLSNTLAEIAKSPEITSGTTEDAARLISREGCIALNTYRIRVWNFSREEQTLKCIACYNNAIGGYTVQEDFNMQNIEGFGEYLSSNRILAVNNSKKAMALIGLSTPYDPEVCAVLFAPVTIDSHVVGLVCVEQDHCEAFPTEREWSLEEQSFVSSLADFMVIAITNVERQNLMRQLETELSKSSELWRVAYDNAPMGLITFADDRAILECNEAILSLLGVTEDYFRKNYYLLLPEYQSDGVKSLERWEGMRARVLRGEKVTFEWTYQRPDGTLVPCEITVVRIKQGDAYVGMTYVYDLSNVKKLTCELEKQDNLLKAVNRTANVLLAGQGSETFEILIYKGLEIIGCCVDADYVRIWENEKRNGDVYAVLKHYWRNELACLIEPVIITEFPYDNTPDWYNRLSHGEIIMGSMASLSKEDREYLDYYKLETTLIIPIIYENQYWGLCCIDNFRKSRSYSNDEIDIIHSGLLMVISAINRNNLTLRKMEEEKYRNASEAKSRFLATMSHEIRTPMNVIIGSTETLLENESHTKETRDILEKIYNSGDLLLHIINDILDLSKIEASKIEIVPQKYGIASLINDTVNLSIIKYGQKDIKFSIIVDENLPVFLFGDDVRIKQIINNLVSNAFKYTYEGEISVSFFQEKTTQAETTLVIRVTDTGQGMTGEQVEKLFSEYTRFNLEANRTTMGTGLGLVIAKNLAELMKGKIEVESAPGKGSSFTVRIPQMVIDSQILGREAAENIENLRLNDNLHKKKTKIIKEPMPYGKVLIVDDMRSNIDVALLLMKPYQLQIDTAESGYEAIELIKSGKTYDLVFMDHMMPKMDGIETVKRIREWEREQLSIINYQLSINNEPSPIPDPQSPVPSPRSPLPIIALTANAIVGQAGMFMENGFDGCITKPIDTRELDAVLNEYIRNRKTPAGE